MPVNNSPASFLDSSDRDFIEVAKALLILCWYLDYDRTGDYTATTRRDMLESVIDVLRGMSAPGFEKLKNCSEIVINNHSGSPFEDSVKESLGLFINMIIDYRDKDARTDTG